MAKKIVLAAAFLLAVIVVAGCSSGNTIAGGAVATEKDIYEPANLSNQAYNEIETQINDSEEKQEEQKTEAIDNTTSTINATINATLSATEQENTKTEEFKFGHYSIVSTQHNISLSLDDFKHEIKSGYWGKIIEITVTVLNKGNNPFKPKVIVLLYDEKDFKEDWLKPKAEIGFDVTALNIGEHITKQAIVNIPFDDINITKNFKLILVDAADAGNKPIAVVENEFTPIK